MQIKSCVKLAMRRIWQKVQYLQFCEKLAFQIWDCSNSPPGTQTGWINQHLPPFAFLYLCLISIAVGTVCKSERSNLNGLGGGWIAFHCIAIKVLSSPSRWQNANMVHCIKDIKPPDWQMLMAVYKICHHMEVSWVMGRRGAENTIVLYDSI